MSKPEILSQIKKAEEYAREVVAQANENRNRRLSDAKAKARNITASAEEDIRKYRDETLASARELLRQDREAILEKGRKDAEAIKSKAQKNVGKAAEYLVSEFERVMHASA
ncbi:MAG TPA: ATP synthase archaeal subunit H [Candidatus Methanoperedenaceae archaeon]|nr:ATP synthase archaeal subunit H [Candidatus Methanoperedenaceae archaeon]